MSGRTVRTAVLERDGNRCQICGATDTKSNPLTMHHIKFKSKGGRYTTDNLITWCWNCHREFHSNHSHHTSTVKRTWKQVRKPKPKRRKRR